LNRQGSTNSTRPNLDQLESIWTKPTQFDQARANSTPTSLTDSTQLWLGQLSSIWV